MFEYVSARVFRLGYLPDGFCSDIDGGEDAWRRFN